MSSELSEAEAETLYLLSVAGMRDSVIEGIREDLKDCATELDWSLAGCIENVPNE